jgi:hypothetical protein
VSQSFKHSKSALFSAFAFISSIVVVGSLAISPSAVSASGGASITVGNSTCDLPTADLGRGNAQNPFTINSAKSLAEIADCRLRTFTITNATVDGNQVTFTANNELGVGHSVTISGVTPSEFNVGSVRVVAATASTFTVQLTQTLSASYASGGTVGIDMDFYELTADIDLSAGTETWNNVSANGWLPIPDTQYISFNGNNKTINGLTMTQHIDGLGLFAQLRNANVQNLNFTNVSIDQSGATTKSWAGALLGRGNNLNIRNVHVRDANVIGSRFDIGLLGGEIKVSNVSNVSSSGVVGAANTSIGSDADRDKFPDKLGGLFGEFDGNLDDARSSATVNGYAQQGSYIVYGQDIGGLVGDFLWGNLTNSYATGDVIGTQNVGGLAGSICCGDVYNVYATGSVHVVSRATQFVPRSAGGLFGLYDCCGVISHSYATGDVTVTVTDAGNSSVRGVGGFIGYHSGYGSTTDSYATGNVSVVVEETSNTRDVFEVGGFYGDWGCCGGDVRNYATGDVTVVNNSTNGSVRYVGGYSGALWCCGTVEDLKATGDVTVTMKENRFAQDIGGLVGHSSSEMAYNNVRAEGNVNVNYGRRVGALVGHSDVSNMYFDSSAIGNVTVGSDEAAQVGGFIGFAVGAHHIERSSSSGTVSVAPAGSATSVSQVGGFIGAANGTLDIADSFTRSDVTVTEGTLVGGFIGSTLRSTVLMNRVYVANTVIATGTNAIVDAVSNGSFVNVNANNVFDQTLSTSLTNKANFVGKSTSDMKTQATFTSLGYVFDGDTPVWKFSSTDNGGYPALIARVGRRIISPPSTPTVAEIPSAPTVVLVPGPTITVNAVAQCVMPRGMTMAFENGSSQLTAKANRQIRSYVTKVKASNCTQLNLRAYYVKNSPLAKARNRVLVAALKKEFWRQQHVVRIRASVRVTKSRGAQERTVRFTVPR